MNDIIGTTDGMGEPGSDAWTRVTGIATAGILVAEGRVRGRVDTERDRHNQDRRRTAEERLRDAADRTRHTPPVVAIEHIPDSKITFALWHDAATTPADPTAPQRMRAAERHLRISEPDLMARYDAEVRAGREPLPAMASAMRQSTANPNPPTTAPTAAWPTGQPSPSPRLHLGRGDPHAHTPTTTTTAVDTSRMRRLRNLFTGKGTHQ